MSRSKHVTATTTAQSVTITKGTDDPPFNWVTVINNDGGATGDIYFTVNGGATAPTAVAEADDTLIACTGLPAAPVNIAGMRQVTLSIIASAGTPDVAIVAS